MRRLVKTTVVTGLKAALAAGLVLWLLKSGRLDFRQLGIVWRSPLVLFATIGVWLCAPILLGSLRWLLLLKGLGYRLRWIEALRLQFIGIFFNAAMPGAVSGDLVKATYVMRENRDQGKTPAMVSVLLDRIMGLFGLFTIGSIVILTQLDRVLAHATLRPMALFLLLANVGGLLVLASPFIRFGANGDPLARFLEKPWPGFTFLRRIYESFGRYRENKTLLIASWLVAVAAQFLMFVHFTILTHALITPDVRLADLAVIFPIGTLTTALPLAPGGIGVGHMAFESLFKTVGLKGGANVFNVSVLCSLALSLLGALPFILKGRGRTPAVALSEKPEFPAPHLQDRI